MTRLLLSSGMVLLTTLVACSGDIALFWRQAHPAPLAHLSREEVRSTMGDLTRRVKRLNELLETRGQEGRRGEIATILAELDELVERLEPGDHPGREPDLAALHETIRRARLAVRIDPPDYRTIEQVPYACIYCHAPPV